MAIKIMIQFNGKSLTIPINPDDITISRDADNNDINIIGLGKTTRKGEPGLKSLAIDSFFPSPNSYFYTGVTPKTCVEFIENIWNSENINNNVAKLVTVGLPIDLNMYFVINKFNYDHKAGEENDIYYSLAIKQYVPYGVKTVNKTLSGLAAARADTSAAIKTTSNTYTVQSGDCLWNITKACCGDGSRYMELYNLNKSIIGNNPNLIKPGQVLTLPNGWSTPTNVTKLKDVSTGKSSSTKTASESANLYSAKDIFNLVTNTSNVTIEPIIVKGEKYIGVNGGGFR